MVKWAVGGEKEAVNWLHLLRQGNWEAITTLTLTCLPSVEEVVFHGEDEGFMERDVTYPHFIEFLERVAKVQENGDLENPLAMRELKRIRLK